MSNKTPELYYLAKRSHYYRQIASGQWVGFNQENTRLFLKSCGLDVEARDQNNLTEVDRYLLLLQGKRTIDDVISLAGYRKGLYQFGEKTALVTHSPNYIEAVKGDYGLIDRLFSDILGAEQQQHFYAWLKVAMLNLRDPNYAARGQALFFVGPARSCKSLMQDLITYMLGGRCEKPHQYLMGITPFNAELFAAEHLKMEDDAGLDYDDRGTFSIRLKGYIANTEHSRHEKGFTPNTYSPKWRMTVSLNNDSESVKIVPIVNSSIADKVNIYKCEIPDLSDVIPLDVIRNELALAETFKKQLPAFIHFILNDFEIPDKWKAPRFGINQYHNKEILGMVTISPSIRAFNDTLYNGLCLDRALRMGFYGKATDFIEFFKFIGVSLERSFNTSSTFGRRAGEVMDIPECKNTIGVKNTHNHSTTYTIANDITFPNLAEHSIKAVMDEIRDTCLKDNHIVTTLVLRKAFEQWVEAHQ
jgi:hypothetical protein